MPKPKFSDYDLGERIRQGKKVSEIAAEFGVSVQAIYKRSKRYHLNVSKDVAFHQAAAVNRQHLDWSAQLMKINETANTLLDRLIDVVQAKEQGDRKEKLKDLEPLLGDKGILDAAVKIKAEIRQQLRLLMDAWKQKYDVEQIDLFQRIVLEEIGKAAPEVREQIIKRLQQECAVTSVMGWGLSP
ncbi:MAG: hypothetical protein HY913_00025 [Desulfomonile tiedjei]|nr:hypothetical protein [Desulfomonile tiedjei]